MKMKTYEYIAMKLNAIKNCKKSGNEIWWDIHKYDLDLTINDKLNSSGFETTLNDDKSNEDKIVLDCSYHVMSSFSYYVGYLDFTVIVTAKLFGGFTAKFKYDKSDIEFIKNNNREIEEEFENIKWDYDDDGSTDIEGLKEYIEDTYYHFLDEEITG
jgi:predicted component of viral defense system (DUF524 family)